MYRIDSSSFFKKEVNKKLDFTADKIMHILFISDADYRYGAAHSLLRLVELLIAQSDRKVIVTVLMSHKNNELERQLREVGADVICVMFGLYNELYPFERWKFPFKYIIRGVKYWYGRTVGIWRILHALDMNSIDIIHCNSSRVDIGAILSRKCDIPLVWHLREFYNLDYRCYTYRKDYIDLMNCTSSRMIAVSNAVCSHWIEKGINPKLIEAIYNGVDVFEEKSAAEKEAIDGRVRFVFAGSLNEGKGHCELIEAVSILPVEIKEKIIIDVIGDGNSKYHESLKDKVERDGLTAIIRFLGYKKDITELLFNYDVGLMCSRAEAFGRVTVEYMMAGLVVIASDSGANLEIIRDGVDGLLYKRGDSASLADKIVYLVNHKDKIREFGEEGYQRAQRLFTAQRNAEQIYGVYQEVLKGSIMEQKNGVSVRVRGG